MDEEISAWEKRAEAILGAFERRWAIPKRMRHARLRWRRHSQSRLHQLCTGRGTQPEGARGVMRRALQGEVRVCGGDQGRVRTAFGRRCAHAEGAGTHRALLEENNRRLERASRAWSEAERPAEEMAAPVRSAAAAAVAAAEAVMAGAMTPVAAVVVVAAAASQR